MQFYVAAPLFKTEVIIVFFGSGTSLKWIMFFEGVLFLCFWGVRGGCCVKSEIRISKSETISNVQNPNFQNKTACFDACRCFEICASALFAVVWDDSEIVVSGFGVFAEMTGKGVFFLIS